MAKERYFLDRCKATSLRFPQRLAAGRSIVEVVEGAADVLKPDGEPPSLHIRRDGIPSAQEWAREHGVHTEPLKLLRKLLCVRLARASQRRSRQ